MKTSGITILQHTLPIDAPVKKNKLPLFKTSNTKEKSKSKAENEDPNLRLSFFRNVCIKANKRWRYG